MLSLIRRLFSQAPEPIRAPARTSLEGERLTDWEIGITNRGHCPDCGQKGLLAGPSGGLAQNFKCANPGCGSRFNDLMIGVERISNASPDRPPDPAPPKLQPYR